MGNGQSARRCSVPSRLGSSAGRPGEVGEQISVFVAAEINNLNTLRARDADFKDAGISVGTRVKVRETLGQGAASSSEGGGRFLSLS